MESSDKNARNDNHSFAEMIRIPPDRAFADQAVTLTIEGLFDRGVSHYHVAKSLFDMALSLSAGDGRREDDNENWYHLLEYFHEQVKAHRQMLKEALAEESE